MLQLENEKDMPEWLKKCISCTHSYTTQNEDLEVKCRCRNGCNFKPAKKDQYTRINKDLAKE